MNHTEDEIIDALTSDKLNEMIQAGTIQAIVLKTGTVSLVYRSENSNDTVLTNYVQVGQK